MAATPLLDKGYDPQVRSLPSRVHLQIGFAHKRRSCVGGRNSRLAKETYHWSVVQILAAILAPVHRGVQPCFGNRQPHLSGVILLSGQELSSLNSHPFMVTFVRLQNRNNKNRVILPHRARDG